MMTIHDCDHHVISQPPEKLPHYSLARTACMAPSLGELARRALVPRLHQGSVVAFRGGENAEPPSRATQSSASVLLFFVGIAALGFIYLLFTSVRDVSGKPKTAAVVSALDEEHAAEDGNARSSTARRPKEPRKTAKSSSKSKSRWTRQVGKARGKHEMLPTEDFDEDSSEESSTTPKGKGPGKFGSKKQYLDPV
ncbi:MAG: hypothetical protein SGPRY_000975 [Prymnesium sp.]